MANITAPAAAAPVTITPTKTAPVATPPAPEVPVAPPPPEKRKFKLKVDGQEREEQYSDDEVTVRLQKGYAAEKRMEEAAKVQKKWAELKQLAKDDPTLLFKELVGADPDEWAEGRVKEKWQRELMPEQERQMADLQKQLKDYQTKEQKRAEAEKARHEEMQQTLLEKQIETDFKAAFEASGLPYTSENLEVFGKIALDANEFGIDLTPAQMVAEAKAELARRETAQAEKHKGQFTNMEGPALLDYLGDAVVKKVLKAAVEKYRPAIAPPAQSVSTEPAKPKVFSTNDWRRSGSST
jgi:hypothetical protein